MDEKFYFSLQGEPSQLVCVLADNSSCENYSFLRLDCGYVIIEHFEWDNERHDGF